MYRRARLNLTFVYSLIFLAVLWLLSLGVYLWFAYSLNEGYVSRVQERHVAQQIIEELDEEKKGIIRTGGDVALEQLRETLILFNGGVLFIVPLFGWWLTGKTLQPIELAYEQQKQFVSSASHEMRTPLSVMAGEMELALRKERSAESYRKIIASSKEEIDRLVSLLEKLLFLARGENARLRSSMQEVDITDVLQTVVAEFGLKVKQKKIKVELEPAEEIVLVKGQESMLQTLFGNLLDNAIKYTPAKGRITLTVSKAKGNAIVKIRDTGIGIKKNQLKKIFERFYRADNQYDRSEGFGLGLAIVQTITDWHKGEIELCSEPDKGTTFTVKLPLAGGKRRDRITFYA